MLTFSDVEAALRAERGVRQRGQGHVRAGLACLLTGQRTDGPWRPLHARWHDAVMKAWLRQGIWLVVALIAPLLLALALSAPTTRPRERRADRLVLLTSRRSPW